MPTTNSTIQFKHGLQETFSNITKDSNTIYFITDTNRLFVGDSEYTRPVQHGSELPTSKNPINSLFVKETGTSRELYYSKDGTAWDMIAYLPATITGGVFGNNTAGTVAYGGTVKVPKVTVDNRGYVTAAEDVTLTLPTSDKVTTVTTSGDGNAVTGGSISDDGATLTLIKGESFIPTSGGTFTGAVTLAGAPTTDLNAVTKKYVDDSISSAVSASDAMVFKGTVGTSGTVASISAMDYSTATTGDTYKVITTDTLPAANSSDSSEHDLTPGDLIVYMGESKFIYVPSGDEDVTSVKIAGSGDTINVSTTAQTGTVVLGDVATKKVSTSTTLNGNGASNDNVPTELAVKTYVDDTNTKISVSATTRNNNPYWGTISGALSSNLSTTPSNGNVVLGSAAAKDVICEFGPANLYSGNKHDSFLPSAGAVFDLVNNYKTCIALHNPQSDKNIDVPIFNPEFAGAPNGGGARGLIILGSTAGKDATTSISDTDDLIPTSKAIKTYVDDSIDALTDTKVTTVTTSGDGNAVTGGSISDDGATLTLTKGESFIPTSGGTFTGAVTLAGAPTTDLNAATKKYVDDAVTAATLTWKTF